MNVTHIKTLESHLNHWKRLNARHICEEKEGRETIEALQSAIEALQTEQKVKKWIPCKKRMPKKDQEVFVYLFGDNPYIAVWDGDEWQTSDFTLSLDEEPTAWMPLPEPFKAESEVSDADCY